MVEHPSLSVRRPGPARHPTVHLLLLVRLLSKSRRGRPRGSHPGAASGVEQTPHCGNASGARTRARESALSPRELALVRRPAALLCLGSLGLPAPEGARPNHESGLNPDDGGRKLRPSNQRIQSTLANRLTYLWVIGWGWFYLLNDNVSSYLSAQLGSWLAEHGMTHTRGKPYHPMTQGKIERYHRSMKNQILLENYYLPGQLEQRLAEFVEFYNLRRYHESLDNLTPADVYFGRGQTILTRRENIKLNTIELRRRLHHQTAATASTQMDQILS